MRFWPIQGCWCSSSDYSGYFCSSGPKTGSIAKALTGISGFDSLTLGGLPSGRPSLVCGAAGSGKTLFAVTFLVNGIRHFNEPGVLISFEERAQDLAANVLSLGYDLEQMMAEQQLVIDHVRIERSEIEENGAYDLEGLFVRLQYAVNKIGAKRIVLDTIETLFSSLLDTVLLRAEISRLFGWIKDRGLTAVITAERGDSQFTRHGLEEYVSDCVILLDNRVHDQVTTRRLRVVKYRGSTHGTNEYPFLIDGAGLSVLPITAAGLAYSVSYDAVSSGTAYIDSMLGIGGFYRGSSVLLSGEAGTGKTILASTFLNAACEREERALYFLFEESADQICRNVRSIGLDLARHVQSGLLLIEAARPSLYGLEAHLARMQADIEQFQPNVVVIDPISSLRGPTNEVYAAVLRMVDLLKTRGVTGLFTSLRNDGPLADVDNEGLSSLMDTWIKLANIEADGERNRVLAIVKSRGMSHSNQVREYQMTAAGIALIDVYVGPAGVLTGNARVAQVAREEAAHVLRTQEVARRRRELERRRLTMERQIEEMRAALEADEAEAARLIVEHDASDATVASDRLFVSAHRGAVR